MVGYTVQELYEETFGSTRKPPAGQPLPPAEPPSALKSKYDVHSLYDETFGGKPIQTDIAPVLNRWAVLNGGDDPARLDKVTAELRSYLGNAAPPAGLLTLKQADEQLRIAQMDHATQDAPYTARWVFDRASRNQVPYDAPGLAGVEKSYGRLIKDFTNDLPAVARVVKALPQNLASGAIGLVEGGFGLTQMLTDATPAAIHPAAQMGSFITKALEAAGVPTPSSVTQGIAGYLHTLAEDVRAEVSPDAGIVERGLLSAETSVGQTLPTLLMAPLAGVKAIQAFSAVQGGVVAGQTYLRNLEETKDPTRAALHGILDGAFEYVFERVGGEAVLLDKAQWAKGFLGGLAKFVAREVPSEVATTFAQNADEWALLHPEKSVEDFLAEQPEAALETIVATLAGGGAQVGIVRGLDAAASRLGGSYQAEQEQQALVEMFNAASQSQLFQNDPQAFGEFLQSVSPDQSIRIEAPVLAEALASAGRSVEDLPSLAEQGGLPGEIEVPVHELVTALAGTPGEAAVIPHIRLSPEAQTIAERRAAGDSALDEFMRVGRKTTEEMKDNERFSAAATAVREEIESDLAATGAYKPGATRAFADMVATTYAVTAKRLGITPVQLRDGWADAKGNARRGYALAARGVQRTAASATPKDFAPGRVGNILRRGDWAILTAENPQGKKLPPEENAKRNAELRAELGARGYEVVDVEGKYVDESELETAPLEHPFLVFGIDTDTARALGEQFDQDSILTKDGLVYHDGTVERALRVTEHAETPENYWTRVPSTGAAFTVDIDFGNRVPLNQSQPAGEGAPILDQSVSTRVPSMQAGRADPHITSGLAVSLDAVAGNEGYKERLAALFKGYPSIRTRARKADTILRDAIEQMKDNLRWLYLAVPDEAKARSRKWYEGGRVIAERFAEKYGYTPAQVSAVIAVTSPQTQWDVNMSRAERILDTWTEHQDTPWSSEMSAIADRLLASEAMQSVRKGLEGKTLGELPSTAQQAIWLRLYDEAHNLKKFRLVTPEGGFTEYAPGAFSWANYLHIEKGLQVLKDGSRASISRQLGDAHKVRNFYNNIFDPSDTSSVTIDTHAAAAALLLPLSGQDGPVAELFGGPADAGTGHTGTYIVYAEAYRELAAELGVLPRELQSVTWEALRTLYPNTYKASTKRGDNFVADAWARYKKGESDADAIRAEILEHRGGSLPSPSWAGHVSGLAEGAWASSYTEELLGRDWNDRATDSGRGDIFAQSAPGSEGLSVVGVHFSPAPLTEITPERYGSGYEGAERARVLAATDARLRKRSHFYVNTGAGIFPESGVGGNAHVARLTNLYDARVDALGLFKGRSDNAAESALLDAGYSGYLADFGRQAAAVVFGDAAIPAEKVDGLDEANARAEAVPPPVFSPTQLLRKTIVESKLLPHGMLTGARWAEQIRKHHPDLFDRIAATGAFEAVEGSVYRDGLAAKITPPVGELYQAAWHSPLATAIGAAKQEAMPGAQWKSWLQANKAKLGLKDDEIQWSGITDYLDLRGKDKVMKAEVLDYLSGNGVRVEDVVKGADQDWAVWNPMEREEYYFATEVEARAYAAENEIPSVEVFPKKDRADSTKFSGYWDSSYKGGIPGTYREILVTLPTEGPEALRKLRERSITLQERALDEGRDMTPAELEEWNTLKADMALAGARTPAGAFKSGHWDESNVLVHVRLDEVTGADGKRYVRVGEVQSDWGQKGKKEGFSTEQKVVIYRKSDGAKMFTVDTVADGEKLLSDLGQQKDGFRFVSETVAAQDPYKAKQTTPSAPFVTDTKAWVALGIKRAIIYAAQVGADGVVFGTGQQNADLYDLSKSIGEVQYRNGDLTAWDLNGKRVINEAVEESEVEDYIGKEAAAKLLNKEAYSAEIDGQRIAGLDLKVGGEGMRAFYDKIVPSVANDVLKKLGGGKVSPVGVKGGYTRDADGIPSRYPETVDQPGFPLTDAMRTKIGANGMPLFQDAQSARGTFRPETLEYSLLAQADLSTFMHEVGHFYLTMYMDLAQQIETQVLAGEEVTPGEQGILDDMNAVLEWMGEGGVAAESDALNQAAAQDRIARARAQGFDTEDALYHWSSSGEFKQFRPYQHFGTEAAAMDRYTHPADGTKSFAELKARTQGGGLPPEGATFKVWINKSKVLKLPFDSGQHDAFNLAWAVGKAGRDKAGKELLDDVIRRAVDRMTDAQVEAWAKTEGMEYLLSEEEGMSLNGMRELILVEHLDRGSSYRATDGGIAYFNSLAENTDQEAALADVTAYLNKKGVTALSYKNDVEDPGSISYIVPDPKNVRSTLAAFEGDGGLDLLAQGSADYQNVREQVDLGRPVRNPGGAKLRALADRAVDKSLRGIFDREGNLYVWDAYKATHQRGAEYFGVPYDYTNRVNIRILYDGVRIDADKELSDRLLAKYGTDPQTYFTVAGQGVLSGPEFAAVDGVLAQGLPPTQPTPRKLTLSTWHAMSLAEQTAYHEKFAETWEQYLFTGKAPTKNLQSLFRRITDWMRRVYLDMKRFVAERKLAAINPEISAVMDRLVATEEEIAAAIAEREQEALFKEAVGAGMTPEQYAAYLALSDDAKAEAEEQLRARSMRDMKWLQNRRNKTLAALQKDAKELRKQVHDEVAAEVAEEPLYRAIRWLRHGIMRNPDTQEDIQALKGHKLDIKTLEEMYPAGQDALVDWRRLGYGKYGMLSTEGLHPSLVAEMFGFATGYDLVAALVESNGFKAEVEGRTDQRMLERYGDLVTPEGIAKAADEAIVNEARLRMLSTELARLAAHLGSPAAIARAAKVYAEALVGSRIVKKLNPKAFAADATRAGKAATQAWAEGDGEKAATHKRTEILNHAAAQEAYAAEKLVQSITAKLTKIARVKDEDSAAKSRNMDLVNAIRVVLADFGFGNKTKGDSARKYLDALKNVEPDLASQLEDLVWTATDNAKHWKLLKVSELKDLHETVAGLWGLAKRAREVEIDGKRIAQRDIVDQLVAKTARFGAPPAPGKAHAPTPEEERRTLFSTLKAQFRRVSDWAERMDGGKDLGPFRRFIWFPIKDAADRYRAEKESVLRQYRDLLKPIGASITDEPISATELGYTFGKGGQVPAMSELLHALLHSGNESNKRKLLLGRDWATENPDGTLNTTRWDAFVHRMEATGKITKAHWDFVQGVWDLLETTKVPAQKAHRAVFGRSFAEVTADAVATKYGDYRGGYVPAMADSRIVPDAAMRDLANQENESMAYAYPSPTRGFTKTRVEYNRPLLLDLRSLAGHIDKVLLFSHLAEPVADVRRTLMNERVFAELNRIDPAIVGSMLTPWLNRAAKQVVEVKNPGSKQLSRFWSVARSRAGMAAMFANLTNTVQQVTGLFTASVKVKPSYLLGANARYLVHPKETHQFVVESSAYMKERLTQGTSSMTGDVTDLLINPSKYESVVTWTQKHAYFLQTAVDNVIGPVVWLGAYQEAQDNGAGHDDARRLADDAVRQTQGSQLPEEIANFEVGSPFYRMFTQFAGYFNAQANMLGTEFAKIPGGMGLRKGLGRGLYLFMLGFVAPAMVSELIVQAFRGGPGDDDKDGEYLDDWLSAMFVGSARYAAAMFPAVGPTVMALANTFNHKPYDDRMSTAPAISMVETALRAPVSVYKAWAEDETGRPGKAVTDTATAVSMLLGVPARTLAKPIAYAADVEDGRIAPTDSLDYARGLVTGVASPESKQ